MNENKSTTKDESNEKLMKNPSECIFEEQQLNQRINKPIEE